MKKYLIISLRAFVMVMLSIVSTVLPVTIAPDLALAEPSTLFSENFEGMAAKLPSAKWTHTPPTGWKLSNDPKMPQGDAPWQGWSFTTLDVWKAADVGIQARDEFTKASGVFAIADPDEWDDRNSPASKGTFNSTLATPSIDVTGADNLKLTFDSHWRPYDDQTGLLLASFDGGTPVEILRYDSNNTDDSGFRNQTITKNFNVPDGASKLVLRWQLLNANNDWYWAIDNIALTGDVTQPAQTPVAPVEQPTNLALNKTTSQSSNAYGSNNGIKAVDGKTNGDYWDDSVTHTANNPQEWWQVDLGDVYDIDTIRVYNRTDCCSERLSNFAVMVASEPFPTQKDLSKALPQSTWSQKFSGTAGVKEEFRVKSSGRYVRVQLAGTNYLSLAEVEVFGTPAQTPVAPAEQPTNLALNKTTSQSSNAYGSNNGIKAVDGKTNGDYWDDSVTHTANNPQEWWQVDLGDVYDIDTIRVYNRTDCCSERLSNFAVMVASEPFPTQKDLSKALPQSTWSQKFSGTAGVKEEFRVKSSGRYVRVQLAGTNYLSLAEVEVFGTPAQTPVVTPTEPETAEVTNPTPTCDVPYVLNPGNNHCYGKTNELTWSDAQAVAKAAGGNLVTINDRAEQDWLEKTFGTLVWIGLYVPGQNDASEFEWVSNGQAPSYTRWGVDQPQKHGEYFVLLTKDSTWHDYSQSAQFPGIIEIEPGSQTSSVNIDPTQNYDSSTAVTRNLPAGEYKVEVIGTAQGGQFDAWSRKCNCKWDTYYSRRLGSSGPKKIGNPNKYNSKAEALANRVPSTSFTLTDETDVKFYTYSTSAADNIGGVSMQVEGNGIKQSVDLDATQNVNKEHAEICSLPAGDYTVTLLGTAEGGKYDAWSSTCSKKWRHAYKIRGDAKVTVAETGVYDNAGEAFAHRPAAETFRLKAPGEVKFYTYSASPENDCGGVSLNVTRIGS